MSKLKDVFHRQTRPITDPRVGRRVKKFHRIAKNGSIRAAVASEGAKGVARGVRRERKWVVVAVALDAVAGGGGGSYGKVETQCNS